jgi:hypothetical protein
MSDQVMARLRAHAGLYPDAHHAYPGNGHVIQLPNESITQLVPPPIPNRGNPVDSARAALQAGAQT